ncbi:MAG: PspC domain-containing protein [Treponema sp.]|nr:PspC domain-containing protein [Candidatus Treponema merdequi]
MEKKLVKSSRNKVITGTCGGVGEYFNVDPTIIRLVFCVAFFIWGTGLMVYILAVLIIPNAPVDDFDDFEQVNRDYHEKPKRKNKVASNDDDDFDSYFEKK